MDNLRFEYFSNINLNDPFFDSLKSDYQEFSDWFIKKSENNERAFIFEKNNKLDGFLYLKKENEEINDIVPPLPKKERLKIGTFKINPHGTRLGERFIRKAFDIALIRNINEIYVTIFEKHIALVDLFLKYGFQTIAKKNSINGTEIVLLKDLNLVIGDITKDYPSTPTDSHRFILSLYPKWHSRLLPDSILNTEDPTAIIKDYSYTNSIHKIYLTKMSGTENLKRGDTLIIYRTADNGKKAEYSSVVTSVCVVEEVRHINSFKSLDDFLKYTNSYSIFTKKELTDFYNYKIYPIIIKFTYNFALNKRIIRKVLIEDIGLIRDQYWGFFKITEQQYREILEKGEISESIAIH